MRTDGRTDKTKLIVAFQNPENAPKNISYSWHAEFINFIHIYIYITVDNIF